MTGSKQQISRSTAVFAGGTLFSRALGLVRDMVVAALIPAAALDAFLLAFKLPNMLRDMLGEGATNAAFVPVFSQAQEKERPERYRELVASLLSAMLLLFGALTLLGVLVIPFVPDLLGLLRPLTGQPPKDAAQLAATVRLMQWTFPYLFLIGLAVFAMAPLFTSNHYATPAWSPALLNVALIACCLFLYDRFENPSWALVAGVWLGGILQLGAMFAAMRRHVGVVLPNFHLRDPGILKVALLLGPVIVGQAAGEVNKLVDSLFAYSLEHGTVRALFYANRLIHLPLAIFGIAVSVAILPGISRAAARKDDAEIHGTLLHGLRQTFFLVGPAMVGLMVLAPPIVRLLFQRGEFDPVATQRTATALRFYAIGLLAFAWVKVCVQGFYAEQNTKTPVIVASGSMLLNILLNCVLVGPMGFRGLALSTSVAFTVNFVLLYVLLTDRFGLLWDRDSARSLVRMLGAIGVMGFVAWAFGSRAESFFGTETLQARAIGALLPIAVAALAYLGLCRVFRLEELDHLLSAFRRRIAPSD